MATFKYYITCLDGLMKNKKQKQKISATSSQPVTGQSGDTEIYRLTDFAFSTIGERIIRSSWPARMSLLHPLSGIILGSSTLKFAMSVSANKLKCNLNSSSDYKSYSE